MQKKLSPWCKKAKIAMIQNDISHCRDIRQGKKSMQSASNALKEWRSRPSALRL